MASRWKINVLIVPSFVGKPTIQNQQIHHDNLHQTSCRKIKYLFKCSKVNTLTIYSYKMWLSIRYLVRFLSLNKRHLSGNLLWIRTIRRRCNRIGGQDRWDGNWSFVGRIRLINRYYINYWDAIRCSARLKYKLFLVKRIANNSLK